MNRLKYKLLIKKVIHEGCDNLYQSIDWFTFENF